MMYTNHVITYCIYNNITYLDIAIWFPYLYRKFQNYTYVLLCLAQVILYTLTIPCSYAFLWLATFGGAGLRMDRRATWLANLGTELYGNADHFLHISEGFRPMNAGKCYDVPASLPHLTNYHVNPDVSPVCNFSGGDSAGFWFDLMNQYYGMGPFLGFMSIVTTVLYFITSSDSGSLVVDLIAANGREASVAQRVFWALTEGAVAMACLASGGFQSLGALQAVSIVMGLPLTFILIIMCTSLWRALKLEAGHLAPINKRTDWTLPLYGGIFWLAWNPPKLWKMPSSVQAKYRWLLHCLVLSWLCSLQVLEWFGYAWGEATCIVCANHLSKDDPTLFHGFSYASHYVSFLPRFTAEACDFAWLMGICMDFLHLDGEPCGIWTSSNSTALLHWRIRHGRFLGCTSPLSANPGTDDDTGQ